MMANIISSEARGQDMILDSSILHHSVTKLWKIYLLLFFPNRLPIPNCSISHRENSLLIGLRVFGLNENCIYHLLRGYVTSIALST